MYFSMYTSIYISTSISIFLGINIHTLICVCICLCFLFSSQEKKREISMYIALYSPLRPLLLKGHLCTHQAHNLRLKTAIEARREVPVIVARDRPRQHEGYI